MQHLFFLIFCPFFSFALFEFFTGFSFRDQALFFNCLNQPFLWSFHTYTKATNFTVYRVLCAQEAPPNPLAFRPDKKVPTYAGGWRGFEKFHLFVSYCMQENVGVVKIVTFFYISAFLFMFSLIVIIFGFAYLTVPASWLVSKTVLLLILDRISFLTARFAYKYTTLTTWI